MHYVFVEDRMEEFVLKVSQNIHSQHRVFNLNMNLSEEGSFFIVFSGNDIPRGLHCDRCYVSLEEKLSPLVLYQRMCRNYVTQYVSKRLFWGDTGCWSIIFQGVSR